MATFTQWEFLRHTKINVIVQTLASRLEMAQPLIFLNRTAVVNAEDDEIIGKYRGRIFAADLIALDAEAVTYDAGQLETYTQAIPKIKIGFRIGEKMLKRFMDLRMSVGDAVQGQNSFITNWENQKAMELVMGIRKRVDAMICAMHLDSFVYDRLGFKLTTGWGTPADLKVTTSTPWSNTAATPIADIQALTMQIAPDTYGESYNRITMSTAQFRNIVATDEFQTRAKMFFQFNFAAGALGTGDLGQMRTIFEAVSGVQLELSDTVYWVQNEDGSQTSTRVLPETKVILSNIADDNDPTVMDFANGVVIESYAAQFAADVFGIGGGEQVGPIAYYVPSRDLNPPSVECWAVARGFPRKHRETATAVLTVG